jgi:hypothetical protein
MACASPTAAPTALSGVGYAAVFNTGHRPSGVLAGTRGRLS